MRSTIYLLIAAIMEIIWVYCLREVSIKKFLAIRWKEFFKSSSVIKKLFPFIGYIVFGIGNVVFLTMAIKIVSPAIAFGVWMSLSMIGMKLVGVYYFKEKITRAQVFYMLITFVGIVGLKITENG